MLCAGNGHVPFMADEAILAIPGLGKIDYNLKYYMRYLEKIQQCVKKLNKKGILCFKTMVTVQVGLIIFFLIDPGHVTRPTNNCLQMSMRITAWRVLVSICSCVVE